MDLKPSKLGTKQHWDTVYEQELANFQEIGDVGEIWFGKESVDKIIDWCLEFVPPERPLSILEVGSGNGVLLFGLKDAGYDPSMIAGIDYSADAVKLARSIAPSRGGDVIHFAVCDFLRQDLPLPSMEPGNTHGAWDLVLDKGTFDAIALGEKDESGKSPAAHYPERVSALLKEGSGLFLITSCNFTEEELKNTFSTCRTDLVYIVYIRYPSLVQDLRLRLDGPKLVS